MFGRQLVIVLCGFGWWLSAAYRLDLGVGEFPYGKRLTVPALRVLILFHRRHYQPAPTLRLTLNV